MICSFCEGDKPRENVVLFRNVPELSIIQVVQLVAGNKLIHL